MTRKKTKIIKIGNTTIGGGNPIAIQSMTTKKTSNTAATLNEIRGLEQAGCDIIRVAVFDKEDANALGAVKKAVNIPLVADIHFDYRLALIAIEQGIDKLRINPGNIGNLSRIKAVVSACRNRGIPIRIGVNSGSLEKDLQELYKKEPANALIESARRHISILESLDFTDIVLSIKATDPLITVQSYRNASRLFSYPLHIGLTEAGTLFSGTIRSAAAMGILLDEGIGDTIRISLTGAASEEVRVAKELLATFNLYKKPIIISCPTCGRIQYDMQPVVQEIERFLDSLGNVEIKVAIMGCAVNGPGEAKDADIGIAGGSNGALLFRKGEVIRRLSAEEIITVLKQEITAFIKAGAK